MPDIASGYPAESNTMYPRYTRHNVRADNFRIQAHKPGSRAPTRSHKRSIHR